MLYTGKHDEGYCDSNETTDLNILIGLLFHTTAPVVLNQRKYSNVKMQFHMNRWNESYITYSAGRSKVCLYMRSCNSSLGEQTVYDHRYAMFTWQKVTRPFKNTNIDMPHSLEKRPCYTQHKHFLL